MTDAQIFQWLGLTFFAIGMGMLANPKFLKDMEKDFSTSSTDLFFGGLVCLAIGFPLITFHNIWTGGSTLIITILGWMTVVKGLALLMFPAQMMNFYKKVLVKGSKSYVSFGVLALGIILLYFGYFA